MRQRGPVRHTLHECAAASSARLKSAELKSADGSAPTRMWIQLWNCLIAHAEAPAPRAVGVFLPMYTIGRAHREHRFWSATFCLPAAVEVAVGRRPGLTRAAREGPESVTKLPLAVGKGCANRGPSWGSMRSNSNTSSETLDDKDGRLLRGRPLCCSLRLMRSLVSTGPRMADRRA